MFKPNTVLVLGAGASSDFGFPLGGDLKAKIKSLMSRATGTSDFSDVQIPLGAILEAVDVIRAGIALSSSVDNFLQMREHDHAIALCAGWQLEGALT